MTDSSSNFAADIKGSVIRFRQKAPFMTNFLPALTSNPASESLEARAIEETKIFWIMIIAFVVSMISTSELLGEVWLPSTFPIASLPKAQSVPWPIAAQRVVTIDDWLQIKADTRPAANQLVIPRLFHVVRTVLVGRANAPESWEYTDIQPELTEWRIPIPKNLQQAESIQVWLQFGSPFNGRTGPKVIQPATNGSIVFPAREATTFGSKLRFEPQTFKDTVGYWAEITDSASWNFSTPRAGIYRLEVLQGCGAGMGGSRVVCEIGDQALEFDVIETGHFQRFIWRRVGNGTIKLPAANNLRFHLKAIHKPHGAVGDFRQLRLIPVQTVKTNGDIRAVPEDLVVPALVDRAPNPGRRVRLSCKSFPHPQLFASLYLPTNWRKGQSYPVIVEMPGNGGYQNQFGDRCTGKVEDASLGYGLTGGQDAIWLVVPFLDASGKNIAQTWWGTSPSFATETSLEFLEEAIDQVVQSWGGDADRIVLTGFSRGSLACNYLGLANDQIASRWRAFICYSHYDGVKSSWPYPDSDRTSARIRLDRLGNRHQFVCMEAGPMQQPLQDYFKSIPNSDRFVVQSTGFRNHNDQWVLRPSSARRDLRQWLKKQLN